MTNRTQIFSDLLCAAGYFYRPAPGRLCGDCHHIRQGWQAAIYNSSWNLANFIPFAIFAVLVIVLTRGRLSYRPDQVPQLVTAPGPVETPGLASEGA